MSQIVNRTAVRFAGTQRESVLNGQMLGDALKILISCMNGALRAVECALMNVYEESKVCGGFFLVCAVAN